MHHVVAVRDQQEVFLCDAARALHMGLDVVEQDVIEVGALAVDLPRLLHSVSDVVHVPVPCTVT